MKKCDPLDDFGYVDQEKVLCSHEPMTETKVVELIHENGPLDTAFSLFVTIFIAVPIAVSLFIFIYGFMLYY